MAYRKRSASKTESLSEIRLSVLKNLDNVHGSVIDYGSSGKRLTSVDFEEKIIRCRQLRNDYNTFLESSDSMNHLFVQELKELNKMSRKLFTAVRNRFGDDSSEYDQMGGTKSSERKKVQRKTVKT